MRQNVCIRKSSVFIFVSALILIGIVLLSFTLLRQKTSYQSRANTQSQLSRNSISTVPQNWIGESSKYRAKPLSITQRLSLSNTEIDALSKGKAPYSDRVYIVPQTGVVYTREFDSSDIPLNTYLRLDTIGLLTLPGETTDPQAWSKLSVYSKEVKLEGIELMFVWDDAVETLDFLNILGNAKKAGIRILPDVKYALLTNQTSKNIVTKHVDKTKIDRILNDYPGTVIGFTFDEPGVGRIFEDTVMDYSQIAKEYSTLSGLPINVIEFGFLRTEDYLDPNFAPYFKETKDYVSSLRQQMLSSNTPIFGGTFSYPFAYSGITFPINSIVDSLVKDWRREYDRDPTTPSWFVLAAHDTGEYSTTVEPENAFGKTLSFGRQLPFQGKTSLTGDSKANIFQIITAVATNPTYSRFSWWNWPKNSKNSPFTYSLKGIVDTIRLLGPARQAIDGFTLKHFYSSSYSYTVKQPINGKSIVDYRVAFIHLRSGGILPPIYIGKKGEYIDTISGLHFSVNELGFLYIPHIFLFPKNSTFCLVPAELK